MDCIRVTHPCAGRRQRYCYLPAAPRLACVRPVASVHPEPGSNSSLYYLFFFFSLYNLLALDGDLFLVSYYFFLSIVIPSRISCFSFSKSDCKSKNFFSFSQKNSLLFPLMPPLSRKACAKVMPFILTSKFFSAFFYIPTINISITACK